MKTIYKYVRSGKMHQIVLNSNIQKIQFQSLSKKRALEWLEENSTTQIQ